MDLCDVAPTVKQHLAGLRRLFDYLGVGQVLPFNPATAVCGPPYRACAGQTPILSAEHTGQSFARVDAALLSDVRDRAIIAGRLYPFAHVSAVVTVRMTD